MLRFWRWAALALVALGAAHFLLAAYRGRQGEASDAGSPYTSSLASLAAEHRTARPLEARISGGFPHALYRPGCKDGGSLRPGAVREVRGGSSPDDLGAAAVVRLLDCHPDEGIELLQRALTARPRDPRLLSDLAAAHLQRGDLDSSPYDLVQALTAADRALKLSPAFPEARFNQALALTRLGLAQEAEKAWQEYLGLDKGSGWRTEAAAHLQKLQEPREADLWKTDRDRLDRAALQGDTTEVRRIVTAYRQAARLYVEDKLLGDWALARQQGRDEESGRVLRIARAVADALGYPMLRAEVGAIEEALRSPADPRLAALIRGHAFYAKARELHEQQKYPEAEPLFQRAAAQLAKARSLFAGWPGLYLAIITHHHSEEPKAIRTLEDLRRRFAAPGSPVFPGYVDWMLGQARGQQGPLAAGLAASDAARQEFEQAGEVENRAAMDSTLAQIYSGLGDFERAWHHHYAALQVLRRAHKARRIENTLSAAISTLRQTGDLNAAVYFQESLVDEALRANSPIGVTIALRDQAALLFELGDTANVLVALDRAWEASQRIEDVRLRQSVEVDTLLAKGRILRSLGSADASLKALDEAHTLSLQGNDRHRLIEILQERAETWLTLGREREAEADQEAGLQELERQRRTLGDGDLRVFFADQGRSLLEERIALQRRRGESAETTLETAEGLRARALLDSVGGPGPAGWPEPLSSRDITAVLPAGTTIVEYLWVRNGLLAWVIKPGGVDLVDLRLERPQVAGLVHRFEYDLKNGRESGAEARNLHHLLISPLEPWLRGTSTLIVVPDGVLCHLPFGALQDAATGRFLVEGYALATAPSASVYVVLAERYRERSRSAPASILLLGQPEIDHNLFQTLTSLPAAEKEIETLQRVYRQPLVLTGPAATAERFLAGLPDADVLHYAGHTVASRGADAPSLLLTSSAATQGTGGLLSTAGIRCPRPPRTRVAVLAGCRTAEGRLSQNEGTLGLSRAFLAAGIPVVVASNWDTNENDDPSSRLLLRFHELLRAGADPVTALHQAQLDLLRGPDRRLASPHTWAAFQVTGGAFASANDLSPPPAASPQSR